MIFAMMGKRQKKAETQTESDTNEEDDLLKDDTVDKQNIEDAMVDRIFSKLVTFFGQNPIPGMSTSGSTTLNSTTSSLVNDPSLIVPEKLKEPGKEICEYITIDGVQYQKCQGRVSMPTFAVPHVLPEDQLSGPKNLFKWQAKLHMQLRSLRLIDYIESEYGENTVNLPLDRRVEHDSQALQVLHATVNPAVSTLIIKRSRNRHVASVERTSMITSNAHILVDYAMAVTILVTIKLTVSLIFTHFPSFV